VNEYVVLAARPSTVAEVPVTEIEAAPFADTSYPVTPTLSVDAFHPRLTELDVVPVECRLPGVLGGVVSPPPPPPPAQDPPLTVQLVGAPDPPLTRKPNEALAPGATVPLYSRFFAVTCWPLVVSVASQ